MPPTPNIAALERLSWTSWGIIVLSLLIDTCHARAYPSYNIAIGIWASFCGHCRTKSNGANGRPALIKQAGTQMSNGDRQSSDFTFNVRSSFALVTSSSLMFDVIFCSVWGTEIFESGSTSAKFSILCFIANMFVKVAAAFYSFQMFFDAGDDSDESVARSCEGEAVGTTSDLSGVNQQNAEEASITHFDHDGCHVSVRDEVDSLAAEINPPTKVVVNEEKHFVLPSKIQRNSVLQSAVRISRDFRLSDMRSTQQLQGGDPLTGMPRPPQRDFSLGVTGLVSPGIESCHRSNPYGYPSPPRPPQL